MKNNFATQSLSEIIQKEMMLNEVWKEDCPVGLDRLRLVTFSYFDFKGEEYTDGELVVLDAVAVRVIQIFKELYEIRFPLAQAKRIEIYKGCDETSMAQNNTCAFNHRPIVGGSLISIHSYGLAIDINPIQNPYVGFKDEAARARGQLRILPAEGRDYLNRTKIRPGMVEPIVNIFKRNGFSIWGGDWNDPLDWQHFQPSRAIAQLLAVMTFEDASDLFELYADKNQLLNSWDFKDSTLEELYKKDPAKFMDAVKIHPEFLDTTPDTFVKVWKKF